MSAPRARHPGRGSPYDLFGPHALRPEQVYEHAVEAVLAQCRDRLRRGVSADTVARLLRGQYIRLAALAQRGDES